MEINFEKLNSWKKIDNKVNELKESIKTLVNNYVSGDYEFHVMHRVECLIYEIKKEQDDRIAKEIVKKLNTIEECLKGTMTAGKKNELMRMVYPDTLRFRIVDEYGNSYGTKEDYGWDGDWTKGSINGILNNICFEFYWQAESVKNKLGEEGKTGLRIEEFFNLIQFNNTAKK